MTTTYLLIAFNVLVSLIAFSKMNNADGGRMFFFSPYEVARGRNYPSVLLSHLSHADGAHLLFNMMTLYFFGPVVEEGLGPLYMLVIYVLAVVADAFHVKPLVRYLQSADRFQVLALTREHVAMYQGNRYGLDPIALGDFPATLTTALGDVVTEHLDQRIGRGEGRR